MIQNVDKVSGKEYKGLSSLKETKQETIDKVLELYGQGRSQLYIEKELHMTRRTIRTILLANDRIRGRAEQQSAHAHTFTTLREDAFDIVSDDMTYWLGFLYADGYITNPNGPKKYLGVLLKESDRGHIEKFLEWLKAPQKIFISAGTVGGKSYPTAGVHIGSRKLYEKLQQWGFTHDKSHDAKVPLLMENNKHFWRGMIDGDGYIGKVGKYNKARVHLCGTIDMCIGFKKFILMNEIYTNSTVAKLRNHYTFYVGSDIAKKVVTLLYKDSTVYLQRKFDKYLELIKE